MVDRYKCVVSNIQAMAHGAAHPDGEFVKWSDYDSLSADLAACRADAERWKAKALRQRTELRRLNKYLGPYWSGFRTGLRMEGECRLRGIMNKAFGHACVYAAEHAAIDTARAAGSEDECPACSVGNPGVYIKDGRMVCPHRPEFSALPARIDSDTVSPCGCHTWTDSLGNTGEYTCYRHSKRPDDSATDACICRSVFTKWANPDCPVHGDGTAVTVSPVQEE